MRWSWRRLRADGDPSARVVLCKRIDVAAGYVVFFTNYESRKGRELAARPRAAAVLHWDALHRQVRIEGPVVRSPDSRERPVFREPRARQPDRRMGQRAKRAAGVARVTEATRARVRRTVRHRSRAPRTAQCRGRRIGAVTVCGSTRSSYGRRARIAYTIARSGRARCSEPTNTLSQAARGAARASIPDYLITFSVGLVRLPSLVVGAGSLGGAGGCGGVSASEKIMPCPVSRA